MNLAKPELPNDSAILMETSPSGLSIAWLNVEHGADVCGLELPVAYPQARHPKR